MTLTTMERDDDACARLADLADDLARIHTDPVTFLRAFGERGAGIRTGPAGVVDLAIGGHNIVLGRGFRRHLDDGTPGQVRHFVGIARTVTILGGTVTRWLSEVLRRDPRGSADGELTDLAQRFARDLLDGDLTTAKAGDWIRRHVCSRPEK